MYALRPVNFVDSPAVTGLYEVEGCDGIAPTLHFERGVTYTLVQNDRTNWYHPIGLAYYPDGAHGHGANGFGEFASVPELEFPTPDDCDDTDFQCNPGVEKQAPLYCQDGVCEVRVVCDASVSSARKKNVCERLSAAVYNI